MKIVITTVVSSRPVIDSNAAARANNISHILLTLPPRAITLFKQFIIFYNNVIHSLKPCAHI